MKVIEKKKKKIYIYQWQWCSGRISSSLVIEECAKTLPLILALLVCPYFVNTEIIDHGTLISVLYTAPVMACQWSIVCFSSALNMSKTSSELNLLLLFFKLIPTQIGFHAAHFDYSLNSLYQCYATSLNTFYHRPVSYGIISTV